ncbi:hypothetical protein C8R44DRAFT_741936 [Mycena epipterygia]|nr:hypothetical protein C8R44DRAFT_741936 [Mycena epipterygia]
MQQYTRPVLSEILAHPARKLPAAFLRLPGRVSAAHSRDVAFVSRTAWIHQPAFHVLFLSLLATCVRLPVLLLSSVHSRHHFIPHPSHQFPPSRHHCAPTWPSIPSMLLAVRVGCTRVLLNSTACSTPPVRTFLASPTSSLSHHRPTVHFYVYPFVFVRCGAASEESLTGEENNAGEPPSARSSIFQPRAHTSRVKYVFRTSSRTSGGRPGSMATEKSSGKAGVDSSRRHVVIIVIAFLFGQARSSQVFPLEPHLSVRQRDEERLRDPGQPTVSYAIGGFGTVPEALGFGSFNHLCDPEESRLRASRRSYSLNDEGEAVTRKTEFGVEGREVPEEVDVLQEVKFKHTTSLAFWVE